MTLVAAKPSKSATARQGRFVPTRAGIINLWDYRDEEFVFANGWLVLRGPNGSGKTKALEVLFPFVLDGRIEPRRLNPFASEDRTMKSNLLYRGQESAYSYVWMEFGSGVEHVTVGVGLRAHRHADKVTRWYFVTDGRVGTDFSLLDDEDRPIVRKHLATQLGAGAVRDSAEEHRTAIDARLFGLGSERYEQLLNLVLTLRRPQLAKNLDPARLSTTLADGLRPISEELLVEAARSFDDMEAVQATLDGLVAADDAAKAFLAIYTTYLRTHAKTAADSVSRRRDEVAARRTASAQARLTRTQAVEARQAATEALETAEREPERLRDHLSRLKSSAAYQSVEQLADVERLVRELSEAADRARHDVELRRDQTARRDQELATASMAHADHSAEVSRLATGLAREAEAAGLPWSTVDSELTGFAARVSARVAARDDDVAAVLAAAARLEQAQHDRDRAAEALTLARAAAEAAQAAEHAAEQDVRRVRTETRQRLDDWARRHDSALAEFDLAGLLDELANAIEAAGEPGAPEPALVFARGTEAARQARRDQLAELRSHRSTIAAEQRGVADERAAIAAEHDDAPALWWARPAARTDRAGAPLWRLVRFADAVPETQAAAIEAALEAANLLDAWVHPDAAATADAVAAGQLDGYLEPLPAKLRPTGPTLADLLEPEEQDRVDTERIRALLASIAVKDQLVAVTDQLVAGERVAITTAGQFGQGVQIGGYAKAAPEFIGATARARRRQARLAECDRRLAELAASLSELDRRRASIESTIDSAEAAAQEIPTVAAIIESLRAHDRAAAVLRAKRETVDGCANTHDRTVAEAGAADQALRRVVAERALPAESVPEVAAALRRFELVAMNLTSARRELATATQSLHATQGRLAEARLQEELATAAALAADRKHASEAEQLRTLQATIGVAAKAVLAEVERTEGEITLAERALQAARSRAFAQERAAGAADTAAGAAAQAQRLALREEQEHAAALAPFAHPDLLELLRCPAHLRWPAQRSDWPDLADADADGDADGGVDSADGELASGLPAEVIALHEAILTATRDLASTEASIKQTATRLTRALDELQAQLSAAGHDYRPEWDTDAGIILVKVADEQGYAPVKVFADRIARDRRDQEVLLTESERRILEDTLLGSLARQIHQRTIDARDLVDAMDVEMRSRKMSSGVSIGVGWQLADDLDEEQRAVCKLLEKDPARLRPDDLARLRQHFAARIKTARSVRADQSFRELLATVLDYRRWRVFAFRLHRPGGQAEALTKARHSQLSGGEQSVSLHLPLFAAAHALFNSARPSCPRLLALDEAFAGVDDTGRSELLGLATQFDLDLFMTGYDLWATHANVPGCAHYDLSHAPIEHTVSAMLLVWDGTESLADFDGSLAAALGSPGTRTRPGMSAADESEGDDGPGEADTLFAEAGFG